MVTESRSEIVCPLGHWEGAGVLSGVLVKFDILIVVVTRIKLIKPYTTRVHFKVCELYLQKVGLKNIYWYRKPWEIFLNHLLF